MALNTILHWPLNTDQSVPSVFKSRARRYMSGIATSDAHRKGPPGRLTEWGLSPKVWLCHTRQDLLNRSVSLSLSLHWKKEGLITFSFVLMFHCSIFLPPKNWRFFLFLFFRFTMGSFEYAFRISMPYSEVKDVITEWAKHWKLIVYEHDADSGLPRTHIHGFMKNCIYKTPEALKESFTQWRKVTARAMNCGRGVGEFISDGEEGILLTWVKAQEFLYSVRGYDANYVNELRERWVPRAPARWRATARPMSRMTKFEVAMKIVEYLCRRETAPMNTLLKQ